MTIVLNGASRDLPDGPLCVSGLLELLELGPQPVLVERNGLAVLRREFDAEPVEDGDAIEIVRMVAGG
jgi:thiamine biosynthesis protein ThiS